MTTSPLYPCGKPGLIVVHDEAVKTDPIFCIHHGYYDRITALDLESRGNCIFNRIENSIAFAVAIVIYKSRNLIGSLRTSQFSKNLRVSA